MLAYLALRMLPKAWHLPAQIAALALALMVGISRVVLRVHFASDVAAGFASGSAWLALCINSAELVRWWREHGVTDGRST
jgi:undecaprenyl-diphosphatase